MASPFPDGDLADAAELGAIGNDRVRVWVRQPGEPTCTGLLHIEGVTAPLQAAATLSAATDWTGVLEFVLPAPAPDRAFTCEVGARRLRGWLPPPPRRALAADVRLRQL